MLNYSRKLNTDIVEANTKAILEGSPVFLRSGATVTQSTFTTVAQSDEKIVTHVADSEHKRIIQVQQYVDGQSMYKHANLGIDYKAICVSDTQTKIVKLSSGTDSSIKVNIIS